MAQGTKGLDKGGCDYVIGEFGLFRPGVCMTQWCHFSWREQGWVVWKQSVWTDPLLSLLLPRDIACSPCCTPFWKHKYFESCMTPASPADFLHMRRTNPQKKNAGINLATIFTKDLIGKDGKHIFGIWSRKTVRRICIFALGIPLGSCVLMAQS